MILVFIVTFCIIVALGFGAAAAWSDYKNLKIPNIYSLLIGAMFVPAFLSVTIFSPDYSFFDSWKSHLLSGGIMFLITFVLFYFKKIGGGDAKLISVFSLWAGVSGLMPLLFIMAIMGGVLGAVTLVVGKYRPAKENSILLKSQWLLGAQSGAREVPYGIAIFTGALFAFWQAGYIQPTGLMALAQETMGY